MVLPNPPKSLDNTPTAPTTNFSDTLNRFREELSKSLEESLGVQIKPSKTTYRKSYPSHIDFMKAPNGWRVPDFQKFSGDEVNQPWSILACFLHNWVKLVLMIL